jgi:hypothetical protein
LVGLLVSAALVGCGFEVPAGVDAARDPDAAIDSPFDADPDAAGAPIVLVQKASNYVTNAATVTCAFPGNQTAGNTNIIVVSWSSSSGEVQSLSDSAGNAYTSTNLAVGNMYSLRIFYAPGIVGASANTLTAQFPANVSFPKLRIFEYSGLAPTPFERGASDSGFGSLASSGTITTTAPHMLLFAPNVIGGSSSAIPPFVMVDYSDGDLVEGREVHAPGTYTATASAFMTSWVMMIAAFRGS